MQIHPESDGIVASAERYVTDLLAGHLPKDRVFHSLRHTYDVVYGARVIAQAEAFSEVDTEVLTLAAWFHDTGHVRTYRDHETASCEIAVAWLRAQSYPPAQIDAVLACIEATRMPQDPQTELHRAICDADLFHLTFDSYPEYEAHLRQEWRDALQLSMSDEAWQASNTKFLEEHRYLSTYGRTALEAVKRRRMLVQDPGPGQEV